jgi:uncharacterized protein DUF955
MVLVKTKALLSPDTSPELIKLADRSLRRAGALGKLPTPIEDLIRAANITAEDDADGVVQRFISTLNEQSQGWFRSALQKMRGIADLRQRAIYVPSDKAPRQLFASAHEFGHEEIPWHHVVTNEVAAFYTDDDYSLGPNVQEKFDIEANFFASEIIFQGKRFVGHARDYRPSLHAVFLLADVHGASRQATLHRYIEAQDEIVAAISYLPSKYVVDQSGFRVLRAPRLIGTPKFLSRYGNIQIPEDLTSAHPWAAARDVQDVCEGDIGLVCDGGLVRLQWQSWWNSYALLILLRRKPTFSIIR